MGCTNQPLWKETNLGYFTTPGQAHNAYCEAAKKHFGDFAREDTADTPRPIHYLGSFDCPAAAELAAILNIYKTYAPAQRDA